MLKEYCLSEKKLVPFSEWCLKMGTLRNLKLLISLPVSDNGCKMMSVEKAAAKLQW